MRLSLKQMIVVAQNRHTVYCEIIIFDPRQKYVQFTYSLQNSFVFLSFVFFLSQGEHYSDPFVICIGYYMCLLGGALTEFRFVKHKHL